MSFDLNFTHKSIKYFIAIIYFAVYECNRQKKRTTKNINAIVIRVAKKQRFIIVFFAKWKFIDPNLELMDEMN